MKTTVIVVIAVVIIIVLAGGILAYTSLKSTTSTTTAPSTSSTQTPTTSSSVVTTSLISSIETSVTSLTSTSTSTNASTINIGLEELETGSLASWAMETDAMAQVAINQINANGGVLGHQLKYFHADETTSALAAAQTLVLQDNCKVLIGVTFSSDVEAIMPFLSENHVIGIFTTASTPSVMQNVTTDYKDYQYFFRLAPQDPQEGGSIADFIGNLSSSTTAYYVADQESFTVDLFNIFNSTAAIHFVAPPVYEPLSATDFSTVVAEIAAAQPQLIINAQTGSNVGTFMTELKADPATANIPVIYAVEGGALDDPGFRGYLESSNPTVLNGLVIQDEPGTASTPYNSIGSTLAVAYTNITGSGYYSFPSNSYSAVEIFANAMIAANTVTNTTAIIKALEATNYAGPAGVIQFDNTHSWIFPESAFWYEQIQNGTAKVISPSTFATATYQG